MSNDRIKVADKVWIPGPKAGSHILAATPGDIITAEQAEAWNVNPDGTFAGANDDTPPAPPAPPAPDPDAAPVLPTAAEIEKMTGKEIDQLSKTFELEIPPKMKVADKRTAAAGAIEELSLELQGMEGLHGLTEAEIDALAEAANQE